MINTFWSKQETPSAYEDELRDRLKEAEKLLETHKGKKIGPYVVNIEISAPHWGTVMSHAMSILKRMEEGPETLDHIGASSDGCNYSCFVKSGDEIPTDHIVFVNNPDYK